MLSVNRFYIEIRSSAPSSQITPAGGGPFLGEAWSRGRAAWDSPLGHTGH